MCHSDQYASLLPALTTIALRYYVYVGSPTVEELAEAKQHCSAMARNSTLTCVRGIISFFTEALATVEPRVPECKPKGDQEQDEEEESDDE